jgi:hypothetical protein
MASPIENVLQLGFRFDPKPRDAVTYYLPRLIAGEPMHAAIRPFVHATDIYAREPGALAARFRPTPKAGHRFFFSSFKRQPGNSGRGVRAAGPGHWHTQGHSTDVLDDAGVKIGEAKKFRYKTANKQFTDWLMDEFSCCSEESVVGDRQYVLCKIYVSPKASPDSVARQESDAFAFAPPPPLVEEPVAAAAAPNSNKRPAPLPIAEPSCPKRIRAAILPILTPPMVQPPSPLPVQAPAPHPPRQSILQASTAAQSAPCSPAAARDPFCTETEPPAAAAQELDDDLNYYFDFDADFAKSLEGSLECLTTEQAQEEVPAQADDDDLDFAKSLEASLETKPVEEEAPADEAQDDDVDLDFTKSLEASLETKPVEEETPAEAQDDDDLDFAKSLEDSLETAPTEEEEVDDWFAPLM